MRASAPWRLARTADGSWTLLHPVHGEACHSLEGAWTQARLRYAGCCRLKERALERDRVRLLDIGTGLGWNLAAALEAVAPAGGALEVVSLEADSDVLTTTLEAFDGETPAGAPEAERYHAEVRGALTNALGDEGGRAALGSGHLTLRLGDAATSLAELDPAARFDAIFLDLFSPATDRSSWSPAFLAKLAHHFAPGGVLSTYAAGFAVRIELALAGLWVGRGPRVGTKSEGSVAVRPGAGAEAPPPLRPKQARRLARAIADRAQIPG